MNLYRIETTVKADRPIATAPQFVDWYEGETEAQAVECWAEDCHRYGLPMGKTTKVVRLATDKENQIYQGGAATPTNRKASMSSPPRSTRTKF